MRRIRSRRRRPAQRNAEGFGRSLVAAPCEKGSYPFSMCASEKGDDPFLLCVSIAVERVERTSRTVSLAVRRRFVPVDVVGPSHELADGRGGRFRRSCAQGARTEAVFALE